LLGETQVLPNIGLAPRFVDNERLVVWGKTGHTTIAWEIPSGKLLTPQREHEYIAGIGFPAGGKEILTSGRGAKLVRWDVATGKPIGSVTLRPKGHSIDPVDTPLISPDASRILAGSIYPAFRRPTLLPPAMFDPATGAELFSFPPVKGPTPLYCPSPDLSRIVVLTMTNNPKAKTARCEVWDVDGRKEIREFSLPIFSPNEDQLITHSLSSDPLAALSPDGTRLITLGETKSTPRVKDQPIDRRSLLITGWELSNGKQISTVEAPHEFRPLLTVTSKFAAVFVANSGAVRALDFDRGVLGFEVDRPRIQPGRIPPALSSDGTRLAVAVTDGAGKYGVRIYDWPRGKALHTFNGHTGPISAMVFSPDGKTLATGSLDTTVLLWDLSVIGK
jgi:WD40 repeat protein